MVRRVRPPHAADEEGRPLRGGGGQADGRRHRGVEFVEDQLGIENLYEAANTPLIGYLNNALKAKELFHRDQQYIVSNGEVLIVDEFTGRVLAGRYNEGMHQAIEAKEKVKIKDENQTSPRSPSRTTSGSTRSSPG